MNLFKALPLVSLLLLSACNKNTAPAVTAPAAGTGADQQPPVATVNGEAISRATFDYYARRATNKDPAQLTADQRKQLVDNLVRGVAVAQQAEKEGLQNSPDTAAILQLQRLQTLEQADAENYLKSRTPTDAELKSEYDAQVAALPQTQYRARHILVKTQAEAQKIIEQLNKGAKFEDLAKKDSLDSSKSQGGELGWFSPSTMVKPFADAVAGLKKGQITQTPVQSQFGWHVIQLEDTRQSPVPPFDQVKNQVQEIVESKKFQAYADDLVKQAKVQVNL
jgi:peptidyl-prolyl cis-trans isomerase C